MKKVLAVAAVLLSGVIFISALTPDQTAPAVDDFNPATFYEESGFDTAIEEATLTDDELAEIDALLADEEVPQESDPVVEETPVQIAVPVQAVAEPAPEPKPQPRPTRQCHPSYSGCLDPNASDYDCAGGSGNGPYYTGAVQVLGSDVFDLDRDGDGWACEQ